MKDSSSVGSFMLRSKNIQRDGYIWNMLGTTGMAFQSVILLMVLTRVIGLEAAGIFNLAYTTANLLFTLGKYNMHNYQVSDTKSLFSFGDYRMSRYLSILAMIVAAGGYAGYYAIAQEQSAEKALIILWMCLFKAVDALEDVYDSLYQQQGRLDVSGKLMTIGVVCKLICFIVCLIVIRSLLPSLIITTLFGLALLFVLNGLCKRSFSSHIKEKGSIKKVFGLFAKCLPLFLIGFLSYYVVNAPKYSIDRLLGDEAQAYYGFIAMPVFVVGLMGNYIFNPIIRPLSEKWDQGDLSWFVKQLLRQVLMVCGITVVCIAGAFLLGTPVLSLLYGTDLSAFRTELMILVASGGFLALSNQLMTVVTIIRHQKQLLIGYGVCFVAALISAPWAIQRFGIMGACVLELVLMVVLCIAFAIILARQIHLASKAKKQID